MKLDRILTVILLGILGGIILFIIGSLVQRTEVNGDEDSEIVGIASNYDCTSGWCDGTPTVALPEALGGHYTGRIEGWVRVCADRCATLPVVDYCQCYWGTDDQRIVDLNREAWALVTDKPLSQGLTTVRLSSVSDGQPGLGIQSGIREGASSSVLIPDTRLQPREGDDSQVWVEPGLAARTRWFAIL